MTDKNKNIENLLADDSFIRWIEGRATESEKEAWESWLEKNPDELYVVKEAKKIHTGFSFKKEQGRDVHSEIKKLNSIIDGVQRKETEIKFYSKTTKRKLYWPRVAAVFAIISITVGLSYFLYPETAEYDELPSIVKQTTETGFGETKRLSFSDGSEIILNANSRLTYPLHSPNGDLEVHLEGEAWFDVVPRNTESQRTITVHTKDGNVEVLGTRFNVNSYQEATEVVLQQGVVRVSLFDIHGEIQTSHIMSPGNIARLMKGAEFVQVREVDTELYTSWIENRLTFHRTPITDVANRLEHIYGVNFDLSIPKQELEEIRVSGSIPNHNLEVFLNALEGLLGYAVILDDNTVRLGELVE